MQSGSVRDGLRRVDSVADSAGRAVTRRLPWLRGRGEALQLLAICLVAAAFAYYPRRSYDYPLHRDEWIALARAKAIAAAGGLPYTEPYLGERLVRFDPELGFRLLLAAVVRAPVSEWAAMKYLPVVLTLALVLSAYLLARRFGYGVEAALFTALLPTSVRLLGPGFVVALSLAAPLLFLTLHAALSRTGSRSVMLAAPLLALLVYVHPPTGVAAVTVLALFGLLHRKPIHLITVAAGLLLAAPHLRGLLAREATGTFGALASFGGFFQEYGYVPVLLAIAGAGFTVRNRREEVPLVAALVAFLALNVVYRRLGVLPFQMPTRNYFYALMLMALFAGYGLSLVRSHSRAAAALVAVLALILAAQGHVQEPFYHVVSDEEFRDLRLIETLDGDRAVLDPWTAFAFPAVTGKHVYAYQVPELSDRSQRARAFLDDECRDVAFLDRNRVDIVYAPRGCDADGLRRVTDHVYLRTP